MSDAISTIQLGVGTQSALEHIRTLRSEFRGLKEEMAEFSQLGSSADALKQHTASAASAINKLNLELNKSRNEVEALKTQLAQLASAEKQVADKGLKAFMEAEDGKTKAAKEGAKARVKAAQDEADEITKRYSKSKSFKVDQGFRIGTSETLEEAEFVTQAIAAMLKEQEKLLSVSEANKLAIEKNADAEHRALMLQSAMQDEQVRTAMLAAQQAYLAKSEAAQKAADAEYAAGLLESAVKDEEVLQLKLAAQQAYLAKVDAIRAADEAEHRASMLMSAIKDEEVLASMLAAQQSYLARKEVAEREAEAVHRAIVLESAMKDEQAIQGMLAAQAAILSTREALEREAAAVHSQLMLESALKDEGVIQKMLEDQEALLAARAAAEREAELMHRKLMLESSIKDEEAAQASIERARETAYAKLQAEAIFENRVRDLKAKADEEDRIRNARFAAASPASRLSTAKEAMEYGKRDGNVNARYGSEVVGFANAAGVEALKKAYDESTKSGAAATVIAKKHNDALQDMHSAARGVAGGFHEMWLTWGKIIPLMAGFALAAVLREAVKGFIDLQYQMTFVQALSGDVSKSVNGLTHEIHETAAALGVMPKDAGAGLRSLAQAGLSASEAMFALPTAIKMAVVGETTVGEAAQSLTGIMNAFGKSVGQMEAISDTIVKAAATSNASITSMTEAMKMAAPTAKQFNVSLEETSMILTAMAKSNITGTAAGTATKNMIKEMAAPTTQAVRDMMKDVLGGFSAYAKDGALKPIIQQVEELRVQLERFDRESQAAILVRMFGERGDKAFFSLLKMTKDEIKGTLDSVSDSAGKTADVYFQLQRTVSGQWKMMLAEIDFALADVGKNGEGAMLDVMREIRRLFADESVRSSLVGLTQSFATFAKTVVQYGPTILEVLAVWKASGMVAAGWALASAKVLAVGAALKEAAKGATLLGAAMNMIPWVRLASIIGTVAAGYWLLKERKDTLATKTAKELSDLGEIASAMEKENDKLEERNKLRANGIALAEIENQLTLTNARKQVELLDNQLKAQQKVIDDERKKPANERNQLTIVAAGQDIKSNQPKLDEARANLTAIEKAAARNAQLRGNAALLDASDAAAQKTKDEKTLKAGALHYIPSENDTRSAAGLAKAEGNAILEEYRHQEQMARDRYDNELKLAKAYYKEGLKGTNEYLDAQASAQESYNKAQQAAEAKAVEAINKINVPSERKDIQTNLNTEIAKIKNKATEQTGKNADAEALAVELDKVKQLADARKYAEVTIPSIENAQKRKEALEREAYAMSLLTVEEQNIANARRAAAEQYRASEDDIRQKLTLVEAEILRNQELVASEKASATERASASVALAADIAKRASLQGSLTLNQSASVKAQDQAGATAKDINEQQKFNVALQRSLDVSKQLESVFGKLGKAVGGLAVAYTKYGKSQDDISKRMEARMALDKEGKKTAEIQLDAKKEAATAEVAYYADTMGAAKNFFKEHSKGYEIMQAAEKAFRAFEMAMQVESFLQKTGLMQAFLGIFAANKAKEAGIEAGSTATTLASNNAKQTSNGITALTEALKLPFPANIPAFAVVAAMLASIGVAVGGAGGGSAPRVDIAKERQKYAGTGFSYDAANPENNPYDWELTKSESIEKSLEILADNSDIALEYSSSQLAALQKIRDNISGISSFVIQTTGLRGTRADERAFGVGSAKSFLGFSKSSTELIDSGIYFGKTETAADKAYNDAALAAAKSAREQMLKGIYREEGTYYQPNGDGTAFQWNTDPFLMYQSLIPDPEKRLTSQTIGSVMSGSLFAQKYADLETKKSSFWGLSKSTSFNTELSPLEQDIKNSMAETIGSMFTTVVDAAKFLGKDESNVVNTLNSLSLESLGLDRISLKGLSSDEIEDTLTTIFGNVGDQMAKTVMPGLEGFKKSNEGYLTTLIRVTSGIDSAKFALEQLGITAIDYTKVSNKQGDVAAEIVRDSILITEGTTGVAAMLKTLNGSADELISSYEDLISIRKALTNTGMNTDVTRDMVRGAGGLSELKSGVEDFISGFYTEAEQASFKVNDLQSEFAKLGREMPITKAGFRSLAETMSKDTTPEGQRLYGVLMSLAGAFAEAADESGNVNPALVRQRGVVDKLIKDTEKWYDIVNTASDLLDDINSEIDKDYTRSSRIDSLWGQLNSGLGIEQQLEIASELKDLIVERYTIEKDNAQELIDFGKDLRSYVKDLRTGDMSPLTNSQKLSEAARLYQSTLDKASGVGEEAEKARGELQGRADTYLDLAKTYYASSEGYKAIFGNITGTLEALGIEAESSGNAALDNAKAQLENLKDLRDKVQDLKASAGMHYQSYLTNLTAQLTTLQAISASIGALSDLPTIIANLPAGIASIIKTSVAYNDPIENLYRTILNRESDANGYAFWADLYRNGMSIQEMAGHFRNSQEYLNGSHFNGLSYVPFDGYRAELHKGERVLTAAENQSYGSAERDAMAEKLERIAAQLEALRGEQSQQTGALIAAQFNASDTAADKVVAGTGEAMQNAAWKQQAEPGYK